MLIELTKDLVRDDGTLIHLAGTQMEVRPHIADILIFRREARHANREPLVTRRGKDDRKRKGTPRF
jgi:hypothetical protein